jgi:hypothetical protein
MTGDGVNWDMMTAALTIIGLFVTILAATIGGIATVLWKIASIDKSKVDWTACRDFRLNCPCRKEVDEIKEHLNK